MKRNKTYNKKKTVIVFAVCMVMLAGLAGRIFYLMVIRSEYYTQRADDLHERERKIKAARGKIIDRSGVVLADNRSVCTISVIHSQIKEPKKVIDMLVKELELSPQEARERVEKVSSIERIKTNVPKETGDRIREYDLDGVKVDEDFKRYYPFDDLASRVLGFTGGIIRGLSGWKCSMIPYWRGSTAGFSPPRTPAAWKWGKSERAGWNRWPAIICISAWIIIYSGTCSRRPKK